MRRGRRWGTSCRCIINMGAGWVAYFISSWNHQLLVNSLCRTVHRSRSFSHMKHCFLNRWTYLSHFILYFRSYSCHWRPVLHLEQRSCCWFWKSTNRSGVDGVCLYLSMSMQCWTNKFVSICWRSVWHKPYHMRIIPRISYRLLWGCTIHYIRRNFDVSS